MILVNPSIINREHALLMISDRRPREKHAAIAFAARLGCRVIDHPSGITAMLDGFKIAVLRCNNGTFDCHWAIHDRDKHIFN